MSDLLGPCDFHFRDAVCGFFEIATDGARRIVPERLEPLEHCHGRSVLAVIAFDFHGGHVGPYVEVVLAIVVAPVLKAGRPMPHSAMYPFLLGTSTAEAREHGSAHYHLPYYQPDVDISFHLDDDEATASVSAAEPVLDLTVTRARAAPSQTVRRHYQLFSARKSELYVADVYVSGELMEHEEETGGIVLHRHEFSALLDDADVSSWPFREQWMKSGTETYYPVVSFDR